MMKELQFTETIKAPKETLWAALWQDQSFRTWANFIDEGTYIEGTLEEGNDIQFLSAENGYGVTSLVEKCMPYQYIRFRHAADTQQFGQELRAKEWTRGSESYWLVEAGGITELTVRMEVPLELEDLFKDRFPRALACLKALAERGA